MPIKSSFSLAGDARRKTGGTNNYSQVAFSHFHSSLSSTAPTVSPDSLHSSSTLPSMHTHLVDIDSHHPKESITSASSSCRHNHSQVSHFPLDLSLSSNRTTNTNSHHSRFASTLSMPPSSNPHPTPSSRASKLTFSKFRPPVSASDCLRAWTSPFALRKRQHLNTLLPPPLVDAAFRVTHDALAPSTRSTYAAGMLRFHQFCDSWDINEEAHMPASATLLAAFVGQCSGSYAGNTVRSWLSGIRGWHIAHQSPWHGNHEWVHKGCVTAFKEGTAFRSPRRAPVSLDHLHALRQKIDTTNPLHAAIWAVATVTFFGCHRLGMTLFPHPFLSHPLWFTGETTVKSSHAFNPLHHATRATTITFQSLTNGSSSASIRIPWTKTTKQDGATIILTARSDFLCPVAALRAHLNINCNAPSSTSLFGYRTPEGTWSHMYRDTFLSFAIKTWQSLSLDHVSGHSFRIGGAVTLLLSGIPPEVVAATGGWTSLAFLLYWRRMEEIIPLSTSKAYNSSHISTLSKIFERFRIDQNIPSASLVDNSVTNTASHHSHPVLN